MRRKASMETSEIVGNFISKDLFSARKKVNLRNEDDSDWMRKNRKKKDKKEDNKGRGKRKKVNLRNEDDSDWMRKNRKKKKSSEIISKKKEKLWTKKEWENYLEKVEHTKIKPKFVEEKSEAEIKKWEHRLSDVNIDEKALNDVIEKHAKSFEELSEKRNSLKLKGLTDSFDFRSDFEGAYLKNLSSEDRDLFFETKKKIKYFTASGYKKKDAGKLSASIKEVSGGTENDWRMEEHGIDETNENDVRGMKLFMNLERRLLSGSGLVSENGEVTLFRATKHIKGELGDEISADGNYIDSWTYDPGVAQNWNGTVISTKIPLDKVVASNIGAGWVFDIEREIIVNGFDLDAEIISHYGDPIDEDVKEDYWDKTSSQMSKTVEISKSLSKKWEREEKVLVKLEEEPNPTPSDLNDLKKALGDDAKDKSYNELLILFKTLAKRGYFSNNDEE